MKETTAEQIKEDVMTEMKHLVGIFTEDIDRKFNLVLEVVQAGFERLDRRIDTLRDELNSRIDLTQQAMQFMHESLKAEVKGESASLRAELKADIKDVAVQCRENRLAIGRLEQRFDDLDRRMTMTERNVALLQAAADT